MRTVGTIDRVASSVAGVVVVALGLLLISHSVKMLDMRQEQLSRVTLTPLPPFLRYPGGIAALLLGIPITLFGARLIVRPARLDEPVGRGSI